MSTPQVSIILPAYQVTEFISGAIESILRQSFDDYEIIVVNDGCPDTENLEQTLRPYAARIVYVKQANGGVAAARNTGVQTARASLIAQLDPDDLWEPHYLEVQYSRMSAERDLDVLYPNMRFFGDTAAAGRTFMEYMPSRRPVTFEALVSRAATVTCGVMMRRSTVIEAGLFDPALRSSEDFDLWLRIAHSGGRIDWHDRPLVRYRCRSDSLTTGGIRISEWSIRVLTKLRGVLELTEPQREALDQAIRKETAEVALVRGKQELARGDIAAAHEHLRNANAYYGRRDLRFLTAVMKTAPFLARAAMRLRSR